MSYETFTFNLDAVSTRQETMEGRKYLAVPTVMLVEGVHHGSNGKIFYPGEELSKFPMAWNYKPLMLYHPKINGQGVSACDKDVIERQKLGIIMNTSYTEPRLLSESWFEESKIFGKKAIGQNIGRALVEGKVLETSTGLYTENDEKKGEWNGEKYMAIARNYRPDHLAVLPDMVGACSNKDGCGINLNQLSHRERLNAFQRLTTSKWGADAWVVDVWNDYVIYSLGDSELYAQQFKEKANQIEMTGQSMPVTRKTIYSKADGKIIGNKEPCKCHQQNKEEWSKESKRLAFRFTPIEEVISRKK